jgi:ankyrin repeat protein
MHTNDVNYARWLIETGKIDVNYQDEEGRTKLYKAVDDYNVDMIKMLLEKNADMKIKNNRGHLPMVYHLHRNSREIWTLLKDNINEISPSGDTVLHFMVSHADEVKFLIELGADYNIKNRFNKTAKDLCKNKTLFSNVKTIDSVVEDAKTFGKEGIKAIIAKLVAELA